MQAMIENLRAEWKGENQWGGWIDLMRWWRFVGKDLILIGNQTVKSQQCTKIRGEQFCSFHRFLVSPKHAENERWNILERGPSKFRGAHEMNSPDYPTTNIHACSVNQYPCIHSVRPSVKIAAPPDFMHPLHTPRGIHPDKLPDLLALPLGSDKPNGNILQYCTQINNLSLLFTSC